MHVKKLPILHTCGAALQKCPEVPCLILAVASGLSLGHEGPDA